VPVEPDEGEARQRPAPGARESRQTTGPTTARPKRRRPRQRQRYRAVRTAPDPARHRRPVPSSPALSPRRRRPTGRCRGTPDASPTTAEVAP